MEKVMITLENGAEVKFNPPTAGMLRRAMDNTKGEGTRAFYLIGECTNMSLEELDKLSLGDINKLSSALEKFQSFLEQ
ncbi:hypothetical protein B6S12_09995 [Helicobacter valdiviensis]|uniref:Phage tail assembly protein n=1 Tax=Helicobacter valdiviensis TaxID=1458358 RepID=A0A2W6MS13_9HELI|nr:phage tail assembly protein [Helicobacter valdiviensis]PZT47262.1 hypothetical protein B6S12_09995 [Helicobacter valdiviensis]